VVGSGFVCRILRHDSREQFNGYEWAGGAKQREGTQSRAIRTRLRCVKCWGCASARGFLARVFVQTVKTTGCEPNLIRCGREFFEQENFLLQLNDFVHLFLNHDLADFQLFLETDDPPGLLCDYLLHVR
jgi:hypothetical protein